MIGKSLVMSYALANGISKVKGTNPHYQARSSNAQYQVRNYCCIWSELISKVAITARWSEGQEPLY